jgi:hypothetical protein
VLIIALVGDAPLPNYTCGICGFVMNDVGECPRCKLMAEDWEVQVRTKRLPGSGTPVVARPAAEGL